MTDLRIRTYSSVHIKSNYQFGADECLTEAVSEVRGCFHLGTNNHVCVGIARAKTAIFQSMTLTDVLPLDRVGSTTSASLTIYLNNESGLSRALTCMRVCVYVAMRQTPVFPKKAFVTQKRNECPMPKLRLPFVPA